MARPRLARIGKYGLQAQAEKLSASEVEGEEGEASEARLPSAVCKKSLVPRAGHRQGMVFSLN